MKTTLRKISDISDRQWYEIDASTMPLGRLITKVARYLQGKNRIDYTPSVDMGNFVVVTNIADLQFTGRKLEQKKYHTFSGYHGGIRTKILKDVMAANPQEVIKSAVKGMLPKNNLRKNYSNRLKMVRGAEHNFKIDKKL